MNHTPHVYMADVAQYEELPWCEICDAAKAACFGHRPGDQYASWLCEECCDHEAIRESATDVMGHT